MTPTITPRSSGGGVTRDSAFAGPHPYFDIRAYGAQCDSVTDDTAAIVAAVSAAIFNGGGTIYLPNVLGNWIVWNGTVTVADAEGIRFLGDGASHSVYQGTTPSGTQVRRLAGTAPMLDIKAVTAAQSIRGIGIKGISFDGQGLAATGIKLTSVYGGEFEDVHIRDCTTVCLDMTTVDLAGVEDCQINTFDLVSMRQIIAASGIGLRMDSGAAGLGNSSGNVFKQLLILHKNGVGMQLQDADSNRFYGCTVNRSAGTGVGLELKASNHASSGHARSNAFYHAEFTGGIAARATGFSLPSANNFVYLSTESSAPTITREPGATLYLNTVQGGKTGMVQDAKYRAVLQDEFVLVQTGSGNVGQLRWGVTSGTASDRDSEASHPGILRLDTGAVAATYAILFYSGSSTLGVMLPADMFDLTVVVRLNTNDTDTQMRVGLGMNTQTDPPTNGIYFEKLYADTQWFGVTRSGGVQSRSAVANTSANFARLRIRRINATTIGFSVDGGAEIPFAVNVPTATLNLLLSIKNQTAVSKTFDVDLVQLALLLDR
jgi:hypothetical protein